MFVQLTNTSGLGPANAIVGTLHYLSKGKQQSFSVINSKNIQTVHSLPDKGSMIKF